MRSRQVFLTAATLALIVVAGCSEPVSAQGTQAPDIRTPPAVEDTTPALETFDVSPFESPEGVKLDVPYVPTPYPVVNAMLEMGQVDKADYHMDLGSGDGRIAVEAGKRGARAFGVDINPVRVAEAEKNARDAGVSDRVTFARQDLFQTPIKDATVLTMYLLPEVNLKLRPRILDELKPGTRVVSHAFTMGDWVPDETREVEGAQLMLWIVPAKVAGTWTLAGAGGGALQLHQTYQQITGSLGGKPIREPLLQGDRIQFVADTPQGPRLFAGRVAGNAVTPAEPIRPAAGVTAASAWRLTRAG